MVTGCLCIAIDLLQDTCKQIPNQHTHTNILRLQLLQDVCTVIFSHSSVHNSCIMLQNSIPARIPIKIDSAFAALFVKLELFFPQVRTLFFWSMFSSFSVLFEVLCRKYYTEAPIPLSTFYTAASNELGFSKHEEINSSVPLTRVPCVPIYKIKYEYFMTERVV